MSKRAICKVLIGGSDISGVIVPLITNLQVSEKSGQHADTAQITLDDTGGHIVLPQVGAPCSILLGWEGGGVDLVFIGTIDDVRSRGDRGGGRLIGVSAKGVDSLGRAKEPQQKHFDKKTVSQILNEAGSKAGISVQVDPSLASKMIEYDAMDDESFISMGQRYAREMSGTFKIMGNKAILAKRNGGTTPLGFGLPVVTATWGGNLHDWDIAPLLGRPRFKKSRGRWYDPLKAKWEKEEKDIGVEKTEAEITTRFTAPDKQAAEDRAGSEKSASERNAGEGSVTIEGNTGAQCEGLCIVAGARPGVDGAYRIDSVDHSYNRGGGFTTRLGLKQPQDGAGSDSR